MQIITDIFQQAYSLGADIKLIIIGVLVAGLNRFFRLLVLGGDIFFSPEGQKQAGLFDLLGYQAGHKIAALQGNPFDFTVKRILFLDFFGLNFLEFIVDESAGSLKGIQPLVPRDSAD